ncbi:hypothetical protein GOP47_0008451 [Adiantum capillus-veneris]|uniref:F-box protein n=1 Tax=Adiantum capillus-veneris TaxID=13818 RepID=A0A9D4UYU7_ADICA|nr:hypothetical protein GOP47_0008451 [Adiantum capillus-veneris]
MGDSITTCTDTDSEAPKRDSVSKESNIITLAKHSLNTDSPRLLFLTKDALFIHALGAQKKDDELCSWLQLGFSLPLPHSLIANAWSAGPHLLILLASSLSPFHPGHLSVWNPLSNSLSKLPPFASIWHLITLGFGDNMVVAAGFDCNIQCVIEIYHTDHRTSPAWHVVGHLPLSSNVQEHDEILYCGGCFYVLCMESSMLVIDPQALKLTLQDIPCPSTPKLIISNDNIFMVEEKYFSSSVALWKFDEKQFHWRARPIDCPYLQGSSLKIAYIKGVGMSICFVLENSSILIYDLLNHVWSFMEDCPFVPTSRPLIWEPRID